MENTKITIGKNACSVSNTKMYPGDNNELICLKVYKGDWGHWDEKPEHSNQNANGNYESIMNDLNLEGR